MVRHVSSVDAGSDGGNPETGEPHARGAADGIGMPSTPPRITPLPPVDMEDRIRDLERWTVAASDHLDALHSRDEALASIVDKLQSAAEANAAIHLDARLRRRSAAQWVGMLSGVAGVAMVVLRIRV